MRTVTISCDRCGKVIEGHPVKIVAEYIDRETGDIWPDNEKVLPEWAEKTFGKDFCVDCVQKIVRYALGGVKENPDFKKAVEDMVNDSTHPEKKPGKPVSMAQIDRLEEIVKDAEPEKNPAGRCKLDSGKVMALTKAGWSAKKIADEMGVNTQAIYDARYRLKKEGKL